MFQPQQQQQVRSKETLAKKGKKVWEGVRKKLISRYTLVVVVLIGIVIGVLVFDPFASIQRKLEGELTKEEIIVKVAKKTEIDAEEFIEVDVVSNLDEIKAINEIYEEVYVDAQNDDSILWYGDQMVIYRRESGEIIYQGDTPEFMMQKGGEILVEAIKDGVAEKELLSDESEEPKISFVTDPDAMRAAEPDFYRQIQENDIVAIYEKNEIIVIYNPESQSIVKSGTIVVKITPHKEYLAPSGPGRV